MTARTGWRAVTPAVALLLALAGCGGASVPVEPENPLKRVAEFSSIADETARSQALFAEMGRVLQHPRCLNCHPTDPHPRQGESLALHEPPVIGGPDHHGLPAMRCDACHQAENVDHAGVPGNEVWHLAPPEMGWIGLTLAEICERIKDPDRNGGRDLAGIHEHMARDALVGWAWTPGGAREPAPGTQSGFGELTEAWIDSGAHCPDGVAGAIVVEAAASGAACDACHARQS